MLINKPCLIYTYQFKSLYLCILYNELYISMIARKLKQCKGKDHMAYIFSKGLCKSCWSVRNKKAIPKISDYHLETLKLYKPKRLKFLENNPNCQLGLAECTKQATCIHHLKSKHSREIYLDEKCWLASCIRCNGMVEGIGAKAYELGLKIRHNKK